jgi:hypothetical protein
VHFRWSLVFVLWSLSFVLCCLLSAVCWTKQNPLPVFVGSGSFENRLARFGLLAQEHDRQPATVVVMPMSIVAVICSKHRSGFIPDEQATCQILISSALIHTMALDYV